MRSGASQRGKRIEIIVIGASAGGLCAVQKIVSSLASDYPWPVVIAQHLSPEALGAGAQILASGSRIRVREATDKEPVAPRTVYLAPPNYHLLIESERVFSLSVDDPVNFARPSIDVLFESASDVYGPGVLGVILTGANRDGASGLARIKQAGGLAIVQDPSTAEVSFMPRAAISATEVDEILSVAEIGPFLQDLADGTRLE